MKKITEQDNCTGCSACVNICPQNCLTMKSDSQGFLYPVLQDSEKCIECNLCVKVCPLNKKKPRILSEELTEAYAAYSLNDNLREESSSGGLFSEIAQMVIQTGGVVYGAAYSEDFRITHICVENCEDLKNLRGAKYAQSDLDSTFCEIEKRLEIGQQVLFSGTPCQIAGLQSFLRKDYNNLLTIDIVCHGVPSPAAWEHYISYRAKKDCDGKLPKKINLRSKVTGWSRYRYSNVYDYPDGRQYIQWGGEDLYMKLFVRDYINRKSCEMCQFKGFQRESDITLGDFWGIWDEMPEMDDDKGTSLVLLHSQKGKAYFNALATKIHYKKVTLEQAVAQNPSILQSSSAKPERDVVLERIRNGEIAACEDLFIPQKPSAVSRIKGKASRLFHKIF